MITLIFKAALRVSLEIYSEHQLKPSSISLSFLYILCFHFLQSPSISEPCMIYDQWYEKISCVDLAVYCWACSWIRGQVCFATFIKINEPVCCHVFRKKQVNQNLSSITESGKTFKLLPVHSKEELSAKDPHLGLRKTDKHQETTSQILQASVSILNWEKKKTYLQPSYTTIGQV